MGTIVWWIFYQLGIDIPPAVARFFGIGREATPWTVGSPASMTLFGAVGLLFAVARVSGFMVSPSLPPPIAASLKDAAHLYVGLLIGGAAFAKRSDLGFMAVTLSAVELATFLLSRFG